MIRNNRGQALIIFCLTALAIYLIARYVTTMTTEELSPLHAWKQAEREMIPKAVWDRAEEVHVDKRMITVDVDGKEVKTFIREAPSFDAQIQRTPVLFLHGAAFSSKTWHDLKSLQLVAALGHRAIAIDVPGYGQSPEAGNVDKADYMRSLIKHLDIPHPVLVAASMSGSYVIPYVMADSPAKAWQRATALVAIAPTTTRDYTHHQYSRLQIPVLIIRGEKDRRLGLEATSSLQNSVSNKIIEFEDGGHACYMDDPERWHLELYNFLVGLDRMKLDELRHS